uniref:Uncharacterized protein n=1 Tax=Arundo donax TaxID=35708 RepID=A0A0A8ZB00_ARUDO
MQPGSTVNIHILGI